MKYRLVDYKVKDDSKLRLSSITITVDNSKKDLIYFDIEDFNVKEFKEAIHNIINDHNSFSIFIYFNGIKYFQALYYDFDTNLLYWWMSNEYEFEDFIEKYNLKDEVIKIENKLGRISVDELITFIINYNKD